MNTRMQVFLTSANPTRQSENGMPMSIIILVCTNLVGSGLPRIELSCETSGFCKIVASECGKLGTSRSLCVEDAKLMLFISQEKRPNFVRMQGKLWDAARNMEKTCEFEPLFSPPQYAPHIQNILDNGLRMYVYFSSFQLLDWWYALPHYGLFECTWFMKAQTMHVLPRNIDVMIRLLVDFGSLDFRALSGRYQLVLKATHLGMFVALLFTKKIDRSMMTWKLLALLVLGPCVWPMRLQGPCMRLQASCSHA